MRLSQRQETPVELKVGAWKSFVFVKNLQSVQTRYVSPESKLTTHHFSNVLNRAVSLFKTRYSPIRFHETLTALGNTGRAQSSCPETFCFCENPPECPNEVRVPRIEVDNTSLSQRTSKDLHATTLNKKISCSMSVLNQNTTAASFQFATAVSQQHSGNHNWSGQHQQQRSLFVHGSVTKAKCTHCCHETYIAIVTVLYLGWPSC